MCCVVDTLYVLLIHVFQEIGGCVGEVLVKTMSERFRVANMRIHEETESLEILDRMKLG